MIDTNKIFASAHAVKYHDIQYHDTYIVVTQNRTRRRIPTGYYFEDTGVHIYLSPYYSSCFQHKSKVRTFVIDKVTKEWQSVNEIIEHHKPNKIEPLTPKANAELTR